MIARRLRPERLSSSMGSPPRHPHSTRQSSTLVVLYRPVLQLTGGRGMARTVTRPAVPSTTTRRLLACGVVAGPLYFAVGLGQAFTREGFDVGRHALSLLENGRLGWIQIGNFLVTGLLAVACAVGVARGLAALGRRRAAAASRAAGAVTLAGVAATFATAGSPAAVAAVYLAVVVGWAWLAMVAARLAASRTA